MGWALAIDFGTSETAGATIDLGISGATPRPVEVGGAWRVPSAVLVDNEGTIVVGTPAERQGASRPAAYEATPKRRMGDHTIDLGGTIVDVTDAIAALLGVVAAEALRSHDGEGPVAVCLTHPASWAETRKAQLIVAASKAGLDNVILLPEPVAAATWYAATSARVRPGGRVGVYDLGGGTFDAAVVEAGADGSFATVGRPGGADPLGGVDFDHALLQVVGAAIAERDALLWSQLASPTDTTSRRRRRSLAVEVRTLKEELSAYTSSFVLVPESDLEVTVTRDELNAAIGALVERSVTVLAQTITEAGSTPHSLDVVYLVGGSSRIPLVADLVEQRLGVVPATLEEPKQVVVFGAAVHLAEHVSQRPTPPLPPAPRPAPPPSPPTPSPTPVPAGHAEMAVAGAAAPANNVGSPTVAAVDANRSTSRGAGGSAMAAAQRQRDRYVHESSSRHRGRWVLVGVVLVVVMVAGAIGLKARTGTDTASPPAVGSNIDLTNHYEISMGFARDLDVLAAKVPEEWNSAMPGNPGKYISDSGRAGYTWDQVPGTHDEICGKLKELVATLAPPAVPIKPRNPNSVCEFVGSDPDAKRYTRAKFTDGDFENPVVRISIEDRPICETASTTCDVEPLN